MGGYVSGRWGWHSKQFVVEQCYRLDINDPRLRSQLSQKTGEIAALKLSVKFVSPYLPPAIEREILFLSTPCRYGGLRWWFRCPSCVRRCTCLFIPPYGRYFACRKCHHLTYESAQEAHKWDRGRFGTLAAGIDFRDRLEDLIQQQSRHRIGSKAWLRVDGRIDRLMIKLDSAKAASMARSAALAVEMGPILAKCGGQPT